MISTREDPVVTEVTTTLFEWHKIWISLYLDNQCKLFDKIETILDSLIDARAELLTVLKQNSTPQDAISREQQIVELKINIVNKLDLGNRLLNLDLVPRDANFKIVDPVELSPIKLYHLHSKAISIASDSNNEHDGLSISTTCSAGSLSLSTSSEGNATNYAQTSYHLQLSLKKFSLASLPPDEVIEVYFSIVDTSSNTLFNLIKPITEKFLVQINNDKLISSVPNTIFTNLGSLANRDICLYVQVYRIGKMTMVDGHKTTRLQSNINLQAATQDGSTNSLTSATKYSSNGLSRSRHSTLGFPDTLKYKRPFGVSIIPLKEFTKTKSFKENLINIKVTTSNESDFSQLNDPNHKRTHSLKANPSIPNIPLDFSIKLLAGPQESLSELSSLNSYCLTEKRGYPDIVMPGEFKNDLHFTLESAEFEKGGKSISKNIEASISLVDKAGLVIEKCISPASNCDNVSSYKSCVFYHSNSPKWNESIKISVPLTRFESVHVRIEFRHCSTKERDKKFLGFAFLPLSDEDGTFIADKSHELHLYKCDSHLWDSHLYKDESLNLCKYVDLPYGPNATIPQSNRPSVHHNFSHSSREIVIVNTFLLSTKLTQNRDLLNLLKWKELIERNNRDFEEALNRVLELKGEEIVKFLQDILDTLFDSFARFSSQENDYTALIFKVLVNIFLLLDEPKYQHFRPVLDTYVSAHFSATLVYNGLLACLKKCLEYSSLIELRGPIQRCFKSIKYIFQFIVQSKLLYSKASGEQFDEPFLNDLRRLFKLFELMLENSNQKLIPIQVTFLESFPGTLEQLIKVMSPQELAKVVTSLVGSIGWFHLPEPLLRAKLIFMKETSNSVLVRNQDIRLQITEFFCRHLVCYIEHSEELELCYDVLEILITKIHDYHWPSIYRLYQLTVKSTPQDSRLDACSVMTVVEINNLTTVTQIQANQLDLAIISISKELEPFVNLMKPLLQLLDILVRDYNGDKTVVQKYCTFLLTILKLMGKMSFEQFMKNRQLDYLKLCNLFRSFRAVYNRDWSVMQLTSHSILEHPIDELSRDLRSRNDIQPINRQLSSYIKLIVDFITHPTLQLEAFSERKKSYVLRTFGDLRIKFSVQLLRFWVDLTKANIHELIPTSIQSFLDAALLPNDELQQRLIPVFYDMIDAEDSFKSSSRQIERCIIDNIDIFMNLDRGDKRFIENFDMILKKLIKDKQPSWESRGLKLINSFTNLLSLLLSYRNSLGSPEVRGKQMSCLVDLLNFYKDQDRIDLHLRYLFKLCDMHLETNNHVEAAFTLKLYTDEIRWSHRNLSALDGYRPEELEWLRKEALYHKIIHYFDLGKCWEENIALCKELASFYENFLVDYEKVSCTLKKLAQFLDYILTEHRPEREYFRVEFLGADQPEFVKGKEFIYRGVEYERLAAFMQRMDSEFPESQVLNPKSKQAITKDSPGQFIVISNVKPVPFLQDIFKSGQRNINDKIIQYYMNNRLDTFSYDVPLIKGAAQTSRDKSGVNNVRNLWVGRYILKLKKPLPDILPWSEVITQEYNEISPINHAIETISSMNLELSKLILSYKKEANKQISPLTMRLQGVIEAAVNGGPAVFVDAFLRRPSTEPDTYPLDPELLTRLRDLIKQQFSILETGLGLHSKLAPPDVMPLHARLVERLHDGMKNLLLSEEPNQIVENNYELVGNNNADTLNRASGSIEPQSLQHKINSQDGASKDEVDSHDLNGNIYGEIEDQVYSRPNESHVGKILSADGSKSELSSPSRFYSGPNPSRYYGCAGRNSSSLSTLAVLSNLPVNRSRLSSTLSKETTGSNHSSTTNLNANELCARAARKLTYDSCRADELSKGPEALNLPPFNGNSQEPPPLPPRSFIGDKITSSRALNNTSPLLPARNPSPAEANLKWILKEPHVINLASLSSSEASRVLESMDRDIPPIRTGLPSNLPRLLKSSPNQYTLQQAGDNDPPPLPQRARLPSSVHSGIIEASTSPNPVDKNPLEQDKLIEFNDKIISNLNEGSSGHNESSHQPTNN